MSAVFKFSYGGNLLGQPLSSVDEIYTTSTMPGELWIKTIAGKHLMVDRHAPRITISHEDCVDPTAVFWETIAKEYACVRQIIDAGDYVAAANHILKHHQNLHDLLAKANKTIADQEQELRAAQAAATVATTAQQHTLRQWLEFNNATPEEAKELRQYLAFLRLKRILTLD